MNYKQINKTIHDITHKFSVILTVGVVLLIILVTHFANVVEAKDSKVQKIQNKVEVKTNIIENRNNKIASLEVQIDKASEDIAKLKREKASLQKQVLNKARENKEVKSLRSTGTKKSYYRSHTPTGVVQEYGRSASAAMFGDQHWNALYQLWMHESGWNPNSVNRSSGACGVPQSLPCSKMASFGSDYRTNYKTQINWGLSYISGRYGNPSRAWAHFQSHRWY